MVSFYNSENLGDNQQLDGSGGKMVNTPLARESSINCLTTFDELQGTISGLGKDFGGSVNMGDLLRNIWTEEESQALASSSGIENGIAPRINLQRQGSLTFNEIWSDIMESTSATAAINNGDRAAGSSISLTQNTLCEMTLEEFLLRAEVDREDPHQPIKQENAGSSEGFQPALNRNVLYNQFLENRFPVDSSNITLNLGGKRISRQEQHKEVQSQHQSTTSNEASVTLPSGMPVGNNNYRMFSPKRKVPVVAMSNLSPNAVQNSAIPDGAAGLSAFCNMPASGVAISLGNHMSYNVTAKRELETPPISSLYAIGEGGRGWKSNSSLDKVIERRRKRMMKNRESASRSRLRKQAYTSELEQEVANLKEMNKALEKEQAESMEMQKNQTLQTVNIPQGEEIRRLERASTAPW